MPPPGPLSPDPISPHPTPADPTRALHALTRHRDPTDPSLRFERAAALQSLGVALRDALRLCDFRNAVVLRREGLFVDVGGVLLESSASGYHLKASGHEVGNQGESIGAVLDRFNIGVATAVDVGAHVGEISLWLAKRFPRARIVAIEPSSDNRRVFEVNLAAQPFSTDGIEILPFAVAASAGSAVIPRGVNPMSRVVAPHTPVSGDTEPVVCDRLDAIFDHNDIATADLVKIDIEGGEPRLRDAMVALGPRVRAYLIEFSQMAARDDYLALAEALMTQGFSCFDERGQSRFASRADVERHLDAAFSAGPIAVANLWFIARP